VYCSVHIHQLGWRGSVNCGCGWGTWPERAEELVGVVVADVVVAGVASRL
jgi:hypothetical protein